MIKTENLKTTSDAILKKALEESRNALRLRYTVRAVPETEVATLSKIVRKFLTSQEKGILAEAILTQISDQEIDVHTFNRLYDEVLSWY